MSVRNPERKISLFISGREDTEITEMCLKEIKWT